MIAPLYLLQVLQTLLNHIDLCGYPYDQVPTSSTISSLLDKHGVRKEVIQAVLLTWFGEVKKDEDASTEQVVEIKMKAIVRFMGFQVLVTRARSKTDRLDDFMLEWQNAVGPNLGDSINVEMLKVSLSEIQL
jgi:trehalose utilization protein